MATAQPGGEQAQSGAPARALGRVIPFGKYLLLDRIAVGGMAEVYVAKSFGIEGFEKLLAIKRILPTMAEDHDFITMFVDEAKIAGQLSHPNVVPIYELGRLGDSHYMAMEYVWGKDLLQIMNRFRRLRQRMPPVMVAWIGIKICEALDYAHSKKDRRGNPLGIIHRDISPQNVLVSYEGQVKLIDFGIAKATSRTTKTQAGVLKGKFGYMSPEQVRGLSVDHRSDIFAVGTCMYEMITSERLFLSESDFSTLEKVRNAEVAAPSGVVTDLPKELETIILHALKREATTRFQTAREVRDALQAFLSKHDPLFGTSKLAAWLKTAFGAEMTQEKAKLDSYAQMGRPAVSGPAPGPRKADVETKPAAAAAVISLDPATTPASPAAAAGASKPTADAESELTPVVAAPPVVATRPPIPTVPRAGAELNPPAPHDPGEPLSGEPTQLTPSPFDLTPVTGQDEELAEQPTQIFWSSSEEIELGEDSGERGPPTHPSAPSPAASAVRAVPVAVRPVPITPPVSRTPPVPKPAFVAPPDAGTPAVPAAAPIARRAESIPTPAGLMAPPLDPPRRGSGLKLALYVAASLVTAAVGAFIMMQLLRRPATGTIEIRMVPPVSASVQIDGQEQGRGSQLRIENIAAREHRIDVSAVGYEPTTRRVTIGAGSLVLIDIALVRTDAAQVRAVPASSAPQQIAAAGSPSSFPSLLTPPSAVRSGDAGAAVSRAQDPRPPEHQRMNPSPDAGRPPAGSGSLVINTIPWARVFLDGRDTGRTTPITPAHALRARAGTHQLGLRTRDGTMRTFSVDVVANETVSFTRMLE